MTTEVRNSAFVVDVPLQTPYAILSVTSTENVSACSRRPSDADMCDELNKGCLQPLGNRSGAMIN